MTKNHTREGTARRAGRWSVALILGLAALPGCDGLTVPDYNNPSIEDLLTNPTRTAVETAATGLLEGARQNIASPNAYVSLLGILGRESYNFDAAEPRFVTELLVGPLTQGGAFGGNLWTLRYRNIRNANIVINASDEVAAFSEAERNAIKGLAKTIQALDLLLVINARDVSGAVIDTDRPLSEGPGEIEDKGVVFARIVALLNEGRSHLQAGGSAFPFPLSGGFADFDTPAAFIELNRALKARVDVYMGEYAAAIQSLDESFVDTGLPLEYGAYYDYGSGSGETENSLGSATVRAHPSVVADAQTQPGGQIDRRVQEKIVTVSSRSQLGLSSDLGFALYPSADSPVPIITNEELILLRAEARWFTDDTPGAMSDLNFIRTRAGGLASIALPFTNDEDFVTALLRERRYSLMFEGHRWLDVRRFGRLDTLPTDLDTHRVHARFLIPEAECLARGVEGDCSLN